MQDFDVNRPFIPDLWVERLAAGELSEPQAQALRTRLERDGDPRLAQLELDDAAFAHAYPPARVLTQVGARARVEPAHSPSAGRAGLLLAFAAVMALFVGLGLAWRAGWLGGEPGDRKPAMQVADAGQARQPTGPSGAQGSDTVRIKGLDAHLLLHRQVQGQRAEALQPGDRVAQGTRLQVSYVAAGARRGVILSIDGAGSVTLHYPEHADGDTHLKARGEVPLPFSYELDDAPKYERFIFVSTADDAISVSRVLEAAESLASSQRARDGELELPPNWNQSSFLLNK